MGAIRTLSRPKELCVAEEKTCLAAGVLVTVARVNRVSLLGLGIELSDRAGVRLRRVGCPNGGTQRGNRVGFLEHHWHARARRHERNERRVKRTLAMDRVELAGFGLREMHNASSEHLEP